MSRILKHFCLFVVSLHMAALSVFAVDMDELIQVIQKEI